MKLTHLIATAVALAGLSLPGLSASAEPVALGAAVLKGQAGSSATLVFGPPPPHPGFHGGGFRGGGFRGGGHYGHYGHYGHSGRYGHYGHYSRYGRYGRYGYGYERRGYWRYGRWYSYSANAAAGYGESCYSICRSAGYDAQYCTYHSGEFCS
jgi:hypothetical protein